MPSMRLGDLAPLNGGLRFGPVCPLIDRGNVFRAQYIAVMGVEHASSIQHNLSDMIMGLRGYIAELRDVLPEEYLPVAGLNSISEIREQMLSWGIQHFDDREEYPFPQVFEGLQAKADYLRRNYVSQETVEMIRCFIMKTEDREKVDGSLKAISDLVDYMRGVFEDRGLFMRGESGTETVSFSTIKPILAEHWEIAHVDLQIKDKGSENIRVQMPEHRLFSLFNNIIANGVIHGKKGAPIKVTVGANDGLQFYVTNSGPRIDPEYFELTKEGYPRLFTLEKRWDKTQECFRVPIGSAEIWDIMAIAKGWLQVDTRAGLTRISGFIPEAKAVPDQGET